MGTVSSGDLRNHTAAVLRRVIAGERVGITVRGAVVAELIPAGSRPRALGRERALEILERHQPDPAMRDELAWISGETKDDRGR